MKFFLLLTLVFHSCILCAQVEVINLLTENLVNPLGIEADKPHLSWQLSSSRRHTIQSAYEISVSRAADAGGQKLFWTSGKVTSDQSINVPYLGPALASGERYYWRVRVWDGGGNISAWSPLASWQMGLKTSDWQAQWISPGYEEDSLRASPLLRKEFKVNKKVKSATAYITAHGLYEAQLNGERIGDAYLTPGWTSYGKRLQYQVYDVSHLLKSGTNAIGVTLGNGWYRGLFSLGIRQDIYGSDISLLLQIFVAYTDGTTETIISDGSWKSATGSIVRSEIYAGETIDARLEQEGWALSGFDDSNWAGVKVQHAFGHDNLVATYNEPVRKQETFTPVKIWTTPKGEQVIDFGQNLVGWVVLRVKGKSGDKITLSHAEVLDKEGNFYTENLRGAKAQDTYILQGEGIEEFEPHFSWHGFRYVKVEGYPGPLQATDFTAVAIYSDMKKTGSFTSSNALINKLQHNIEWGLKGNFIDVPTDCPQRDERLGWTGDAQVFFRTASFLRGVNNFFTKWMKDLAADQYEDGSVPHVVPHTLMDFERGSSGWSDAATIIPWGMYRVYGDKRILEEQYESMKAWVGYMQEQSRDDLWNTGRHFGDWLFYSVPDDRDGTSAITDKYFIAQCFYGHSLQLLINTARVLKQVDDVVFYEALLHRVKEAFLKEYITANGATVSNTQTSYVLALHFDMLPSHLRQQAADRLADNIKRYGYHLTTGFLGTPYLCHVLSRFGYTDVAYKLLLQTTYPSWLYPVTKDATTIWERWDGIKPDGSFQTADMNSFNHYAYGAIGDWMYRVMAGIDIDGDGVAYKKIQIRPAIGGDFTHAYAEYETPYGKVASGWEVGEDRLTLQAEIPANTTAVIFVPAQEIDTITEGGKPLRDMEDIQIVEEERNYVKIKVGSGRYEFAVVK